MQVLNALQDAVTNHNLAVQPAPPPEPSPAHVAKSHARPTPVHSFQVELGRKGLGCCMLYMWSKH